MNLKDNFKIDILLKFAAIILAFISAITTAKGFMLFWNEDTYFAVFISWAFAIAVSMALVFASWQISSALQKGAALPIIIIFFMFAFLSFFFNFNFIYGRFTSIKVIAKEAKEIRNDVIDIQQRAKMAIDVRTGYSKAIKYYDSLKSEAYFEENHPQRKGRGYFYARIYAKLPSAKADSALATERYNSLVKRIDELAQKSLNKISIDSVNIGKPSLEKARDGYNQIGAIAKGIDSLFLYVPKQVKGISSEPDYAFTAFINFWKFGSEERGDDSASVFLSMLISFLLDFPIFTAFIILNWQKRRGKPIYEKDIFGDGNNNPKNNKNLKKSTDFDWD